MAGLFVLVEAGDWDAGVYGMSSYSGSVEVRAVGCFVYANNSIKNICKDEQHCQRTLRQLFVLAVTVTTLSGMMLPMTYGKIRRVASGLETPKCRRMG